MRKYRALRNREIENIIDQKPCSGHCLKCSRSNDCPARESICQAPILLEHSIKENSTQNREGIGFAIDVGSTTLAAALYDLNSGTIIKREGCINPQSKISVDVIGRIQAAKSKTGLAYLHKIINEAIETLLNNLCDGAGINSKLLVDGVVTGNTTMLHILTGRSPSKLGVAPFEANWLAGCYENLFGHNIWIAPCIGAFTGADLVCALIAANFDREKEHSLLCDIGTNTEVALLSNGIIYTASTAAGPAFEGTGIKGSELLDSIAQFVASGAISPTGESIDGSLILKNGKTLLNKDVRTVQLAKAAIGAGISIILEKARIKTDELRKIYLAGGFGTFLNPDSAAAIGILPHNTAAEMIRLGNGALAGAATLLLNPQRRHSAIHLSKNAKIIDLGGNPDFNTLFIKALNFN